MALVSLGLPLAADDAMVEEGAGKEGPVLRK